MYAMFFNWFLFHILYLIFIRCSNCASIIEQSNQWPVQVESTVNFTITKDFNSKSEVIIKISDENDKIVSLKSVIIDHKYYVDLTTDYYEVKKDKILYGTSKFSLTMIFYKKSFRHYLVFEWNENGDKDGTFSSFYKEKILLTKPWSIDIKVQVLEFDNKKRIFVDDQSFFQEGKKVKVSCSASGGIPPAKIYVDENLTKRFRDVSYDEVLNQWVGYLTLAISDHNNNVSCRVSDSEQYETYKIVVNHPTTDLKLEPNYNGFTMNGTTITCQPLDGYPPPIIKWDFVSAKNYSNPKLLYAISTDKLQILPTVQLKTELEFNCSAIYTNPFDSKTTTITKSFSFTIGEKPNNINYIFSTGDHVRESKSRAYANLNIAAIGAGVAGVVIIVIAVMIVIMLCRSKPKPSRSSSNQQQASPMYAGSLLAGSKSVLRNQAKSQNGSSTVLLSANSSTTANTDQNEVNYDDMPRGRRPIKVVEDKVTYSTIVGTMQPKIRSSLDLGPIDRV